MSLQQNIQMDTGKLAIFQVLYTISYGTLTIMMFLIDSLAYRMVKERMPWQAFQNDVI